MIEIGRFRMTFYKASRFFVLTLSLTFLSSCPNIFDPFDSPSGDAQILAHARACFDQGDYTCALRYYGRLANNESARADEAFVILDQNNLGVTAFAQAINIASGESVGSILTTLTEFAAPNAGVTKRNTLVNAYKKVAQINNTSLKGFVRFATAIAIAAEILAEESGVAADFVASKTDYASDQSNCNLSDACAGGGDADCTVGSPTIAGGADTYNMSSDPGNVDLSAATPTWGMVFSAITAARDGLTEMGVSTGDSLSLVTTIITTGGFATANAGQCARGTLVKPLSASGLDFGR